jgi:hypothetical protein
MTASNGPAVLSGDDHRFQRAGPVDDRGRRRDRGSGITAPEFVHVFERPKRSAEDRMRDGGAGIKRAEQIRISSLAGLPAVGHELDISPMPSVFWSPRVWSPGVWSSCVSLPRKWSPHVLELDFEFPESFRLLNWISLIGRRLDQLQNVIC